MSGNLSFNYLHFFDDAPADLCFATNDWTTEYFCPDREQKIHNPISWTETAEKIGIDDWE
jgi:hypothetical protein